MLSTIRSASTSYVLTVTTTPLQFGIWIMAAWFTFNGPAGYLTCTTIFSDPMTSCTTYLGAIPVTVNLCHLACHFITGVIGLVAVARHSWTKAYAVIGGLYYIGWGILGMAGGEHLREHLGVDIFGSWVHIVEGSILLLVWLFFRRSAAMPTVTLIRDDRTPAPTGKS